MSYPAKFYQDNAIRVTPDRQSGFKEDVGSRLAGRADLGILAAIRIFRPERDNFIGCKEDDHRLRAGQSCIDYLAYIGAGFPGGDYGFVPFDGRQSDGAQEREDGTACRAVPPVHHEHPPLALDCLVRPALRLTGVPGKA